MTTRLTKVGPSPVRFFSWRGDGSCVVFSLSQRLSSFVIAWFVNDVPTPREISEDKEEFGHRGEDRLLFSDS